MVSLELKLEYFLNRQRYVVQICTTFFRLRLYQTARCHVSSKTREKPRTKKGLRLTIDDSTKRERCGCTKMPAWRHRYSRRAGPIDIRGASPRNSWEQFRGRESVAKVGVRVAKRTSVRSIVFQSSFGEIDIIAFSNQL